jgi:hypothetical protein
MIVCLSTALTVSAGVQWAEAYAVACEHNRFILGGISVDMSNGAAGGWIMGGHSGLSAMYGLGRSISLISMALF